jgi:hypothetical protein
MILVMLEGGVGVAAGASASFPRWRRGRPKCGAGGAAAVRLVQYTLETVVPSFARHLTSQYTTHVLRKTAHVK